MFQSKRLSPSPLTPRPICFPCCELRTLPSVSQFPVEAEIPLRFVLNWYSLGKQLTLQDLGKKQEPSEQPNEIIPVCCLLIF